jgi:hypothetical protein
MFLYINESHDNCSKLIRDIALWHMIVQVYIKIIIYL